MTPSRRAAREGDAWTVAADELELLDGAGGTLDDDDFAERPRDAGLLRLGRVELRRRAAARRAAATRAVAAARAPTSTARRAPVDAPFSGLVFKVQANMDPRHRDRVAFLRVVLRALRARDEGRSTRAAASRSRSPTRTRSSATTASCSTRPSRRRRRRRQRRRPARRRHAVPRRARRVPADPDARARALRDACATATRRATSSFTAASSSSPRRASCTSCGATPAPTPRPCSPASGRCSSRSPSTRLQHEFGVEVGLDPTNWNARAAHRRRGRGGPARQPPRRRPLPLATARSWRCSRASSCSTASPGCIPTCCSSGCSRAEPGAAAAALLSPTDGR